MLPEMCTDTVRNWESPDVNSSHLKCSGQNKYSRSYESAFQFAVVLTPKQTPRRRYTSCSEPNYILHAVSSQPDPFCTPMGS